MKVHRNSLLFQYCVILITIFFVVIDVVFAESLTVDIDIKKCSETASLQVRGTIPALQADAQVLATAISCGCISGFSLTSGTILKASKATPFYANLNLAGKEGRFDSTVIVSLKNSIYDNVIIKIRGDVERSIDINKYIDLGDCFIGAAIKSEIEFNADPSESISLKDLPKNLKGSIRSNGKGRWVMSLLPDCSTAGEFFETLTLNYSQGVKPISIRWSARDPLLKEAVALAGIYTVDKRISGSIALSAKKDYSLLDLTSNNEKIVISDSELVEIADSQLLKFNAILKSVGAIKGNLSCRLRRGEEIIVVSIPIAVVAVDELKNKIK